MHRDGSLLANLKAVIVSEDLGWERNIKHSEVTAAGWLSFDIDVAVILVELWLKQTAITSSPLSLYGNCLDELKYS